LVLVFEKGAIEQARRFTLLGSDNPGAPRFCILWKKEVIP
jgi:hypothetical protein